MSRPDVHREGSRRPGHGAVACHAQMTEAPGMIAFDAGAAQRPTPPPTAARTGWSHSLATGLHQARSPPQPTSGRPEAR